MNIYKRLYEKYGSQESVANAVGVSQKTVHTWSRGSYPSIPNAERIGELLGVTKGEVLDGWKGGKHDKPTKDMASPV